MNNGSFRSPDDDGVKSTSLVKHQERKNADTSDEEFGSSDGEESLQGKLLNPWTRVKVHKGIHIVAYIKLVWPNSALRNVNKAIQFKEGKYFKKNRPWEIKQFSGTDLRLLDIVGQIEQRRVWLHSCSAWEREIERFRSVIARQPYSLLGELIKEGCWKKIRFVLKYFSFDKATLNLLQIDESGCHPTELLIKDRKFKLLSVLVKKYKLKLSGNLGHSSHTRYFSAIFTAVEMRDDPSILRKLYSKFGMMPGFKDLVSVRDELGRTPLSVAVVNDSPRMVEALLDFKAPVNQTGWGGDTALAIGMQMGTCKPILTMLLDAKADVDTPDSTGISPQTRGIARLIGRYKAHTTTLK